MAKKKYEELKAYIDKLFNDATDDRDEKVTRYRQAYRYFLGFAPEKQPQEISAYVEPIVRKAVEKVRPSLMNIFTDNERVAVAYRPNALVPTQVAKELDKYINKVFLSENDGYGIVERAITEALVTGDAFVKYYIEELITEETIELVDAPAEALSQLLVDFPDTDTSKFDSSLTEKNGMVTGKITLRKIDRPIRIEFIPFNDIFVTSSEEDIRDARYVCHRIRRTVGELIELGFDPEKLGVVNSADEIFDYLSNKELVNTGHFTSSDAEDVCIDEMEREVYLYEHYVYTSLVDKKKVKLYKVLATETEILSVDEVSRIPFVHGVPERVPGSFWGVSFYDKFGPAQDILTKNTRAKERMALQSAFGRYIAVKGQYDRQGLLNNRPGGVVEVEAPQAISPFPDSGVNPAVIDGLSSGITTSVADDMMSAIGVDITGANVSATAVAATINSMNMKDKVIAQTLARTLFKPLFEGILEVIRFEDIKIADVPNPQAQQMAMAIQQAVESGQMDQMSAQQALMGIPQTRPLLGSTIPSFGEFFIDVNTANDEAYIANAITQLATLKTQVKEAISDEAFLSLAEKATGLTREEVAEFFGSPQMDAAQQQALEAQQRMAEKQEQLLDAQIGLAAAQAATEEQRALEMIKDGEAKRERDKEKSVVEFEKIEIEKAKLVLKEKELEAEINQQRNITVGRYD